MRTLERTPLRRLQLRFGEPELELQFLLSYRAAARPWIRMSLCGWAHVWRDRTSGASACSCRWC